MSLANILKNISSPKVTEEFRELKRYLWVGRLWAREEYYGGTRRDKLATDEIKKHITHR